MKNDLKVQRAIFNITQEDLANKVSVSRQTIHAIESNKYIPSTTLAIKIAKVFGRAVEDIFILEEDD